MIVKKKPPRCFKRLVESHLGGLLSYNDVLINIQKNGSFFVFRSLATNYWMQT